MDDDGNSSTMDANPVSTVLAVPSSDQDSLSTLANEDEEMNDDLRSLHSRKSQTQKGVRIDDHYYFEDGESQVVKKSSQNEYQEAWYISDSEKDEEDGEEEDHEIEMEDVSEDEFDYREDEGTSEIADTASEMHIELSPEEEAKQYAPQIPSLLT
jgi:pre-rRNA-processing protein TSR1